MGSSGKAQKTDQLLKAIIRSCQKTYVVQLDFSAAFDRVSHSGMTCRLGSISVGGSALSVSVQGASVSSYSEGSSL